MNISSTKVCVVGLGYVGLPLAVEFSKKLPVIGFDINNNRISELKNGQDYTNELTRRIKGCWRYCFYFFRKKLHHAIIISLQCQLQ